MKDQQIPLSSTHPKKHLWQTYLENFQPEVPPSQEFEEEFWANYKDVIRQSITQRDANSPIQYSEIPEENNSDEYSDGLKTIFHKHWDYPYSITKDFVTKISTDERNRKQLQALLGLVCLVNLIFLLFAQYLIFGVLTLFIVLYLFTKKKTQQKSPKVSRSEDIFWLHPTCCIYEKVRLDQILERIYVEYQHIQSTRHRGKDLQIFFKKNAQNDVIVIPYNGEDSGKINQFFNKIVLYNKRIENCL